MKLTLFQVLEPVKTNGGPTFESWPGRRLIDVTNCDNQNREFVFREDEREIGRKPIEVSLDGLIVSGRRYPISRGKIAVVHDRLFANFENAQPVGYRLNPEAVRGRFDIPIWKIKFVMSGLVRAVRTLRHLRD